MGMNMRNSSQTLTAILTKALFALPLSFLVLTNASGQNRQNQLMPTQLPERANSQSMAIRNQDPTRDLNRRQDSVPKVRPEPAGRELDPKPQRSAARDSASSTQQKTKELPAFKGKKQNFERPPTTAMDEFTVVSRPRNAQAPKELPQKPSRRVEIDFENDGSSVPTTVIVRKPIGFEEALEKSSDDTEQIRVQSRTVIAAPPGDLSDLPTARSASRPKEPIEQAPTENTLENSTVTNATEPSAPLLKTDASSSVLGKSTLPDATSSTRLSTEAALAEAELRGQHGNRLREALRRSWRLPPVASAPKDIDTQAPPAATVPSAVEAPTAKVLDTQPASGSEAAQSAKSEKTEAPALETKEPDTVSISAPTSSPADRAQESASVRAQVPASGQRGDWELIDRRSLSLRFGSLRAEWSKFDSRMQNGATSMGLGMAQELMSPWGSLEARASIDLYHATDQAVTLDNVRMLATRTEIAYWLTPSRIRPALTLGMGVTEYAVRSYRAVGANGDVTIRTHARGTAFSVIPGTALRIDLNKDFRFDLQTEYLLHLGGDQSSRSQGLQVLGALGWGL